MTDHVLAEEVIPADLWVDCAQAGFIVDDLVKEIEDAIQTAYMKEHGNDDIHIND